MYFLETIIAAAASLGISFCLPPLSPVLITWLSVHISNEDIPLVTPPTL